MFILENEQLTIKVNENGELVSFENKSSGYSYLKVHSLARFILKTPECLEFEVFLNGKPKISYSSGKALLLEFDSLHSAQYGIYPIRSRLEIVLDEKVVHWKISLENHSGNATVKESYYPIFALRHPEPPVSLLNGNLVSTKIYDIPQYLKAQCDTGYMAPDHKYLRSSSVYPGRSCSVNFFLVDLESEGLYYGCHDGNFSLTFHSFELEKRTGDINVFMGRLPELAPGERWNDDSIVTALYSGPWNNGAAIYRAWADSSFIPPSVPDHIRNMQGWQRIILHHQYGEYFYKYDELLNCYEDGKKAGLDTLLLFGWTSEGMDSGYPVYTPDASQGGFEALRENILKVREAGGHVILYFNGQLIDAASEYYRSGAGSRVSIKRADGTEHREFYNFSDTGNFLREFGNKTFVVACPSCREWLEILKAYIDLAIAVGADSVFFDQIGLASYPCCDPTHGHEVPFIGLMKEKRRMLQELYEYTKSRDPDMALGIECTNDAVASHTDFFHIFGNVAQVWNSNFRDADTPPQFLSDACLFKAAFPETVISTRNLRDGKDVELHVNRMFLLGSRSDVEIYRCRASIAAVPVYQEYLGKVNALRERFREVLMNGKFSGMLYHTLDNPMIQSNSFLLEDTLAVILTQNSRKTQQVNVNVPGYRFLRFDSARSDVQFDGIKAVLPPDSLAVILFHKSGKEV